MDATTVLSRGIAELAIYPAVDPLDSTSRIMDPNIVGQKHYDIARGVQKILQVWEFNSIEMFMWQVLIEKYGRSRFYYLALYLHILFVFLRFCIYFCRITSLYKIS